MKTILRNHKRAAGFTCAAFLAVLGLSGGNLHAQATNAVQLVTEAKNTFDTVLPVAFAVVVVFVALRIGMKAWNKVTSKG